MTAEPKDTATQPTGQTRFIPASRWHEFHVWPTTSGLRHLLFNRHKNGLSACVRIVGRRILIDEQKFFQWIDEQSENAADQRSA